MTLRGFRVVETDIDGVRRLDPVPRADELEAFYAGQYYETLAPRDRRLNGDPDQVANARWQTEVQDGDLIAALQALGAGPRVLDIGAGLGELVESFNLAGFDAHGLEPSALAVEHATRLGRRIHPGTLEDLASGGIGLGAFDVMTLTNVLEHIPEPLDVLKAVGQALEPGGLIAVRVPNDFSEIQQQAQTALNRDPWWIAVPDHVNYFTPSGLETCLIRSGFTPLQRLADFPMELFLLMGDDYTRDPELGKACHRKRRDLELAMGPDLRRRFLNALATEGIGRNITVIARFEPS